MELYEKLYKDKNNGKELDFSKITYETLYELFSRGISDRAIAELYDVKQSKVSYLRKKWNITVKGCIADILLKGLI